MRDNLEGGRGGRKEKDAGVNGRGTDELALARSDGQSERGVAKLNQIWPCRAVDPSAR